MKIDPNAAAIHVDVDNLWILEEEFGVSTPLDRDVVFREALPLALKLFNRSAAFRAAFRATFFIVGSDLERDSCREFCREAVRQGHAIANHTYSHRADFWALSYRERRDEILRCHEAIEDTTGISPIGFRAPGYYLDDELAQILVKLGYRYDSSVFPGGYCALLAAYMRLRGRKGLGKSFGRSSYLWSSRTPHSIADGNLVEFPIYTGSPFRFPAHSSICFMAGDRYERLIGRFLTSDRVPVVYLFHAIDWLDAKFAPEIAETVPALRHSLMDRMHFTERMLLRLNDRPRLLIERAFAEEGDSAARVANASAMVD